MRIDKAIFDKKLVQSRSRAEMLIKAGNVKVNGKTVMKPSQEVAETDEIEIQDIGYVGRGGIKLEYALDKFKTDVKDAVALDIGASTGGFTQCLLKRGAKKVYAVDVGHGQMADEIRNDARVELFENTNAKDIFPKMFAQKVSVAVMDVSFISQTALYPALFECCSGPIISLLKPQFEVEKNHLNKKGIIKDKRDYEKVLEKINSSVALLGRTVTNVCESPILGGDGNKEFLILIEGEEK